MPGKGLHENEPNRLYKFKIQFAFLTAEIVMHTQPYFLKQKYYIKEKFTGTNDAKSFLIGVTSYPAECFTAHPQVGGKIGEWDALKIFWPGYHQVNISFFGAHKFKRITVFNFIKEIVGKKFGS